MRLIEHVISTNNGARVSPNFLIMYIIFSLRGHALAKWLLEFLGIPRNKGVNFHGKFGLGIPRNS